MSPSTNCGWCGALVGMQRIQHMTLKAGFPLEYPLRGGTQMGHAHWVTYVCPACKSANLALAVDDSSGEPIVRRWYPQTPPERPYPDSVPAKIVKAAQEAHSSLGIENLQAAVLMARTTIEASAKAVGIADGNLVAKIDALYDRHMVYEHVRDAAHEVRLFGNDAAHGDLVDAPLTADEVREILDLMDMVLDGVFIAPAKTAAVRAARLAKKSAQSPQTP